MPDFGQLFHEIFQSSYAAGHIPYMLMVASMLMRKMVWLRAFAIAAGATRVYVRAFIVYDPVSVIWEAVLVIINVVQLSIIWWESRHNELDEDERLMTARILPRASKRAVRQFLSLAESRVVEPGAALTTEGKKVEDLMFIVDGVARVERGERLIAICSRGDFVGEMSFIAGGKATATVIVDKTVRLAFFQRDRLEAMMMRDAELRAAIESSFNRNLIEKLVKTGDSSGAVAPKPAE